MPGARAFWAPGRVNLIGEHTDYTGGLVLPAALELGVRIEGVAAERIELTSDDHGPAELEPPQGWGRYVAAVAVELDALGRPAVGFSGRVTSNLPVGAGLSSSAALEVAVATALCAVADFALEPMELALAAQRAELRAVGVPCGIMDQAAAVLGETDHAVLLDTASLEHRAIPLPPQLALLVVDSGVRRRLEDSGYADRRRELEEALAALGGRRPADVMPDELDELPDGPATRRLRHVVTENDRVRRVVELLTLPGELDLPELGRLFREGHESLRDDFEVSIPELDRLVDLAYEAGAAAARMTGGGFGGSIVALVQRDRVEAVEAAVLAGYGPAATAFATRAGAGARELDV
ncbi:MAG TPA: galactokinase [Gaiellaceae bacterium]|jgi:galactokinase